MAQLRAHELRDSLSFQRRSDSRNDYGELDGVWTEVGTAKGKVEPLQGPQENFEALQVNFTRGALIRCRWQSALATLTPSDRVVAGATTYDIRAVIPKRDSREMQFLVDIHTE
jgi:head-tail adaptor